MDPFGLMVYTNGFDFNLGVLRTLMALSDYSGYDVYVTSGSRYDNPKSQHFTDNAVDFYLLGPDGTMLDMANAAYVTAEFGGFTGVGYYDGKGPHGAHIHGDLREGEKLYWSETDSKGYKYNCNSKFWKKYFESYGANNPCKKKSRVSACKQKEKTNK